MGTHSSGDPFAPLYRLLDQIQNAHFEMGQIVEEYKALVERLEERPGEDDLKLARVLPGARYTVGTTFVRESWLKVDAEIRTLFPDEEAP
ncbi:hypothetical protein [Miltoncostaea oceani]|jgi:hypothetical protein|uniref:hypothetical protein n=1 Tax=Miltoncostaea oceani TaxID=2843216 RepID=UPI001C3CC421|nr:hypothetical protein [Miltoncostaea oceani]